MLTFAIKKVNGEQWNSKFYKFACLTRINSSSTPSAAEDVTEPRALVLFHMFDGFLLRRII